MSPHPSTPDSPLQTVRILLEYDGTCFHGWQKQPLLPTIQGLLEKAASRIAGETLQVVGAGRTDAGVHALGQTAHFKTRLAIPGSSWVRALNSLLPGEIVVLRAEYVADDFHARYSARCKIYEYRILNRPIPSAFLKDRTWRIHPPLRLEPMREAAASLLGTHDFTSFRAAECGAKSPIRTLERLEIAQVETTDPNHSSLITLTFEAESFLHHMVRNIVGTLVEVGKGKTGPEEVQKILAAKDRKKAGPTAPPQGLWLVMVRYPEDYKRPDRRIAQTR